MTEATEKRFTNQEYSSGTVGALCEALASHWDIPPADTFAAASEVGLALHSAAFPSSLLSILLSGSYLTEAQAAELLVAPCRITHSAMLVVPEKSNAQLVRETGDLMRLVGRFLEGHSNSDTLSEVFERYANTLAGDPGKALGDTGSLHWGVIESHAFARLYLETSSGTVSLFFGNGPLDELLNAAPDQMFEATGPLLERAVLSMATSPVANKHGLSSLVAVPKEAH